MDVRPSRAILKPVMSRVAMRVHAAGGDFPVSIRVRAARGPARGSNPPCYSYKVHADSRSGALHERALFVIGWKSATKIEKRKIRVGMKKHKKSRTQKQLLRQEQVNISKEADYIIRRAQESDARIVRLGALILFSTVSGDAWLLDVEDGLALCLARMGERQPFHIIETPTQFGIEWTANYRIEGEKFVVIEPSDQVRTIIGYPTREIFQVIR